MIECPAREETFKTGQVWSIFGKSSRRTVGVHTPAVMRICEQGIVMPVFNSTAAMFPESGSVRTLVAEVERCKCTPCAIHSPIKKLQKRTGSTWAVESG